MRRILVGIKRVIDHSVRIHLKPDGSGVVTDGVKQSVNPFCEIALEEALRIRERGDADEVIAVSIGADDVTQQLRTALAMGADRAIRVTADTALEPLDVARCLHALVRREAPMLVLLGKQAIDTDNNQTGQLLAALWDRPQATFASAVSLAGDRATVTREIDEGAETLELELPAVVTADLRLNEPRFVRLPQMLKAKKQPIELVSLEALGVAPRPQFETVATNAAPARAGGKRVDSVDALLACLGQRGLLG